MHQVGLAQTNAPVEEEGVVSEPWILGYLHRGGPGQLVGFAFHIVVEGKVAVEIAARRVTGRRGNGGCGGRGLVCSRFLGGADGFDATYLEGHLRCSTTRELIHEVADTLAIVLDDPIL